MVHLPNFIQAVVVAGLELFELFLELLEVGRHFLELLRVLEI